MSRAPTISPKERVTQRHNRGELVGCYNAVSSETCPNLRTVVHIKRMIGPVQILQGSEPVVTDSRISCSTDTEGQKFLLTCTACGSLSEESFTEKELPDPVQWRCEACFTRPLNKVPELGTIPRCVHGAYAPNGDTSGSESCNPVRPPKPEWRRSKKRAYEKKIDGFGRETWKAKTFGTFKQVLFSETEEQKKRYCAKCSKREGKKTHWLKQVDGEWMPAWDHTSRECPDYDCPMLRQCLKMAATHDPSSAKVFLVPKLAFDNADVLPEESDDPYYPGLGFTVETGEESEAEPTEPDPDEEGAGDESTEESEEELTESELVEAGMRHAADKEHSDDMYEYTGDRPILPWLREQERAVRAIGDPRYALNPSYFMTPRHRKTAKVENWEDIRGEWNADRRAKDGVDDFYLWHRQVLSRLKSDTGIPMLSNQTKGSYVEACFPEWLYPAAPPVYLWNVEKQREENPPDGVYAARPEFYPLWPAEGWPRTKLPNGKYPVRLDKPETPLRLRLSAPFSMDNFEHGADVVRWLREKSAQSFFLPVRTFPQVNDFTEKTEKDQCAVCRHWRGKHFPDHNFTVAEGNEGCAVCWREKSEHFVEGIRLNRAGCYRAGCKCDGFAEQDNLAHAVFEKRAAKVWKRFEIELRNWGTTKPNCLADRRRWYKGEYLNGKSGRRVRIDPLRDYEGELKIWDAGLSPDKFILSVLRGFTCRDTLRNLRGVQVQTFPMGKCGSNAGDEAKARAKQIEMSQELRFVASRTLSKWRDINPMPVPHWVPRPLGSRWIETKDACAELNWSKQYEYKVDARLESREVQRIAEQYMELDRLFSEMWARLLDEDA